jgi:hypothetical protein
MTRTIFGGEAGDLVRIPPHPYSNAPRCSIIYFDFDRRSDLGTALFSFLRAHAGGR